MNRLVDRMLVQSQKTYSTVYVQWRDAIKNLRVAEEEGVLSKEVAARIYVINTYDSLKTSRQDLHLAIVEANQE